LKLWNSIMSGLLLAPLAGCPSDDTGQEGTESTTGDDTTGTPPGDSTTGEPPGDSTTGEPPGDSSTGVPDTGDCQELRELPEPPAVDCSTATEIYEGSIILEEGGTDDITLFEGIREVTGAIRINRQDFTDLNFMACVDTVGADITIFGNEQLTNVDGLHNITSAREFVFSSNDAIEDFNGLPQLEQMDGSVVIRENENLRTISGFHRFVGLNGMGIHPETGLVIGGNLVIQENPVLQDIDGFGQIRVVNGRVQITNNPMLCISSVICVVTGIVQPAEPQPEWSTANNNGGC
jgi:hypothetical protein